MACGKMGGAWRLGLMGVVCGAFMLVGAGSVRAATLGEELQGLTETHPRILAARKSTSSAAAAVKQAFAPYLPRVDVRGDYGYEYVDNPARRDFAGEAYNRPRKTMGGSITQTLFNGFLRESNLDSAEAGQDLAALGVETVTQEVFFEGVAAYLDVLRQRRLVELSRQNEATIRRQLDLEDERVRRGSGIAVDVLQAKSRLQIAKERRVALEGALKDAVSRYTQVFDRSPDIAAMTEPVLPVQAMPASQEEAIERALTSSPLVQTSEKTIELADLRRDAVDSEYYPTIDLVFDGNYEEGKNTVPGVRRDFTVSVRANWNLFNGFSTRFGEAAAAFDYGASKDTHLHTQRKVVEGVKLAWQALQTSRERVELLDNAVNIAAEVFDARTKLREAGKETSINVLDAENEFYNARINYVGTLYDNYLSMYQVLLAVGALTMDAVQ